MKKLLSMILALALVFSFSTTAFAADPAGTDGSITIENAYIGETYTLYKLFNVVSFMDKDTSAEGWNGYVYEVIPEWEAFLASDAAKVWVDVDNDNVIDEGEKILPFVIDSEKKVTVNSHVDEDNTVTEIPESQWADFAKAALAYAKANSLTVAASETIEGVIVPGANNTKSHTFEELDYGYYLVDTTMGLLCALNTTDPAVTIKDKNTPPTISKQVQEDSNSEWGSDNDADIGQKVYYKTKIDVKTGAYGYVVHDKMTKGLTFNNDVTVELVKSGEEDAEVVEETNYTVAQNPECTGCDWNGDGDVTDDEDNGCTFTVTFTDEFLATLRNGDTLWVYYTATLNENAVFDVPETNDTYLKYGNNSVTNINGTETVTHKFTLVKTDGETNEIITGAEFKLYKAVKNEDDTTKFVKGEEIKLVLDDGIYRPANSTETATVISVGRATISGLDKDVYYLEESKQPDGYNKVKDLILVDLTEGSLADTAEYVDETTAENDAASFVVKNNRGVELPSTGGMGTTMFYLVGGIMTIGALVVLVARKRMEDAE